MPEAVIVSACRTPIGSFMGSLAPIPGTRLGATVVEEAIRRAGISKQSVDEVILGCVLPAGMGQAPARQAAIFAGLPETVECTTVNKMCGSGLKSVMLAAQAIELGHAETIVAGGFESMSNAPYVLPRAREGFRMGHQQVYDSMVGDGLWDVYNDYHMGNAAELCAKECNISRSDQDAFAIESYKRAQAAWNEGRYTEEIVPVKVVSRLGEEIVSKDEEPFKAKFEKIPSLKPAFDKNGTVTAANASKINDGAAALVVMSAERARKENIKPLARIIRYASAAKKPEWFTTAPVDAIQKLLKAARMSVQDIDLFEINEAFSVVTLAAQQMLGLDLSKVNVNGGAVALGHPIGASGARILVTLLYALQQRQLNRGLAGICIGGGEASAMIIER